MKFAPTILLLALFVCAPTTMARVGSNLNSEQRRQLEARFLRAPPNAQVMSNEFLVEVPPDARDAARIILNQVVVQEYGGWISHEYQYSFSGFSVKGVPEEVVYGLLADYPELFPTAEQNTKVHKAAVGAWGLDRIDQENLPLNNNYNLPNGLDGSGVDIYIIDSGILSTHTEWSGRLKGGIDLSGENSLGDDAEGHGTHVAGSAAGKTYGVAPKANLYDVRVFGDTEDVGGTVDIVVAAIDWVVQQHKNGGSGKKSVINMSLGGERDSYEEQAVKNAVNAGVVVVVAAGNENQNACNVSPAVVPEAITVGASTKTDSRASWSNYGSCLDIFAPGEGIKSAVSSSNTATDVYDGTSMSSPHVAGAVALFLEGNPNVAAKDVSAAMVNLALTNKLGSIGSGSPNKLLYVGDIGNNAVTTTTTTTTSTTTVSCNDPPADAMFVCQVTNPKKWDAHVSAAKSNGGNLLTIRDHTMNNYLLSKFPDNGKYWIGYNDIANEDQFVWADGTCGDYNNWGSGSPSNSGNGEDCTEFLGPAEGGLWNDRPCTTNRWAYYQFPMSKYQDVCDKDKYICVPGPGNPDFSQTCGGSSSSTTTSSTTAATTTSTSTSTASTTTTAPSGGCNGCGDCNQEQDGPGCSCVSIFHGRQSNASMLLRVL